MGQENSYLLNLHHNSKNLQKLYNRDLNYKIAKGDYSTNNVYLGGDKYLLALYDKSFYSLYTPGQDRGTYYGTVTNSCYSFDGNEFKFLIAYPKTGRDLDGDEGAHFVLGKVTLERNEKLLISRASGVNKLLIYDTTTGRHREVYGYFSEGLSSSDNLPINERIQDCKRGLESKHITTRMGRTTKASDVITIPQQDIELNRIAFYDGNYLLNCDHTTHQVELQYFNPSTSSSSYTVGSLVDKTFLAHEKREPNSQYEYYLWNGNPFTGEGSEKGRLAKDGSIALFTEDGNFRYRFSQNNGEEVSNANLQSYCRDRNNCNMKDLNLVPNIRTYLKSVIVSADIADIANTPQVNEANIICNSLDLI